jgi:hypothetical protein
MWRISVTVLRGYFLGLTLSTSTGLLGYAPACCLRHLHNLAQGLLFVNPRSYWLEFADPGPGNTSVVGTLVLVCF